MSAPRSSFFSVQTKLCTNFYQFVSTKKYPNVYAYDSETASSPTRNTKNPILKINFFWKCLIVPKKVSDRETTFFEPKSAIFLEPKAKARRVPFDQMKVSERGTQSRKTADKNIFTTIKKTHPVLQD